MRKLLLTLMAFVLLSTVANAQGTIILNAKKAENTVLQRNQGRFMAVPNTIKKTPAKITLPDNQMIMGNYTSDSYATSQEGLGLNSGLNLRIGTVIPCEAGSKFDGGTVKSIRFALANAVEATGVFMIEMKQDGSLGNEVVTQTLTDTQAKAGWNTVELTAPYTINAEGLAGYMVGFDFLDKSGAYPLSMVLEGKEYINSYVYGNLGQGIGWYNMGADYGNLSVQCIVEKEGGFPAYDLSVGNLETQPFTKKGEQLSFNCYIYNEGKQVPSSYTLGVSIDDNEVMEISSESLQFENGVAELERSIEIPASTERGTHNLSVYVKTINGTVPTENIADDKASATFNVYTESMPRQKQLVEHFTSQYCTYCPKGIAVLEALIEKRDDIAWVSLHQNMSSADIYTITDGQYIASAFNARSLPGAIFNRTLIPGEDGLEIGIGYSAANKPQAVTYLSSVIDYTNSIPTLGSVNIATEYNEETRKLDITVSGNVLEDFVDFVGSDAALTVYLTEDGLVAKQLNDGKWVTNFTHDNVLRYVPTNVYGDELTINNGTYEKTYTVDINSKWNINNMHVVAFIGRKVNQDNLYDKVWVNNTEMVPAVNGASGIDNTIINGAETTVVARYNANGVRLAAPVKGINIVKMSDGTTKKVVIE